MNLNRLDLVSLHLFILVVRTGSISKGALLAKMAVGAASRRIANLEFAVGTGLLERHSRGVKPTIAGNALFQHAQHILLSVDQLSADLSDYASGIIGVVRLWANTSAITQFLPVDLSTFSTTNPGIRIELEEQNSSEIVLAVLDGRADIGIFADRTPSLGLHLLNYREDQLCLVVPKDHILSHRKTVNFAEVADYDFVGLSRNTSLSRRIQDESKILGRETKIRIQVRSFDAMCQMVASGMGIAILPHKAVQALVGSLNLRLIALKDDWARRQILIGIRDPNAVERHVRLLLDHLSTVTS